MFEEWKEIPNYESKYLISSRGRVMNANGIILKPMKCRNGYLVTCLWKKNNQQKFLIHRLVADAFIDNPSKLKEINHIDENKTNNVFSNLEWCSHIYNMNYGTIREKISKGNKGKILSPEHRAKCALSALNKKWMHKDIKEILVEKDMIPSFILDGWNLGRFKNYVREG